jgi:tyrosyl-tRNA synthetase
LLSKDELEDLERERNDNPGQRKAQKVLAREVTKIVHGAERTDSVEHVTDVLFGQADFSSLSDGELDVLASEIPSNVTGKTVIEYLVSSEIASSNNDARRLIGAGSVSVNGQKIAEDQQISDKSLIKKGKNSFILVR